MLERLGTPSACLLAVIGLALVGCGGETGRTSDDAAAGTPDFTEVALITQTAVGGDPTSAPVVLDTERARDEFAAQFTDARMGRAIEHAVDEADVPDGQELVGAVVAIGCDVPGEVSVESSGRGLRITAEEPARPTKECLAAMTTVALVAVDASLV